MEFLQLAYFCAAAEAENFAEAAKKYGVPAASISHSVKRLETELGVSLFNRRANSVELSERGRVFYLKVRSGLDMLSDAQREACDERIAGRIKILAITHTGVVDNAVASFCKEHPNVSFSIDHSKKENLGKYDVIVTDNAPFHEDYVKERFALEPLWAAVPKAHRLADAASLTVKDLKNEALLLFNDGSGMLTLVNRMCAEAYFSYRPKIQTDDEHSLVTYVAHGLGIAILPATMVRSLNVKDVLIKPITDMERISVLCYNKHKYKTKATTLFLTHLKETVASYESELRLNTEK